jgi:hypothetical protein
VLTVQETDDPSQLRLIYAVPQESIVAPGNVNAADALLGQASHDASMAIVNDMAGITQLVSNLETRLPVKGLDEAMVEATTPMKPAGVKERKKAVQMLNNEVYEETSIGYEGVMTALQQSGKEGGTIVVGAGSIFENPGFLSCSKKLRDTGVYDVVAWAQNEIVAGDLKEMGVDEAGIKVVVGRQLEDVISMLGKPVMLIASPLERQNMNMDRISGIDGVMVQNINTPDIAAGRINNPALVFSRATAVLSKDNRITSAFRELSGNYKKKVSQRDMDSLNNIAEVISNVPLIQLDSGEEKEKKVLDAVTAYKEVVSDI